MSLRQKLFYLKRHSVYLLIVLLGLIFFLTSILYLYLRSNLKQAKAMEAILKQVNSSQPEVKLDLLEQPITILFLGLDSRRGDQKPRCDAIHLVTFSPPEEKIIITSVPRGTPIDLENIATPSAYLGNSCHIKGIDFAVEEISRLTNIKPDHVIKVNFSQVLGALRLLNLPTTPTLQFLRDRKSYYWGDNQRSHNQAVFIKDLIINHLRQVAGLPSMVKQLGFKMVATDNLDFATANSILNWMVKKDFPQNPAKIELVIKPIPTYQINDVHFEESKFATESAEQNDQDFQDYQKDLEKYLKNLADQAEKNLKSGQKDSALNLLKTPFSQQLWLQIENEQLRNQLHFNLLRVYILSAENKKAAATLLRDFITEMEITQHEELKKQAEELMNSL
jgi:anionic cell wall polymer biosynthesis LytR-Cps2A-Psr (LCP) family protein